LFKELTIKEILYKRTLEALISARLNRGITGSGAQRTAIEAKALKKLKHPSRSSALRSFLNS
jgi:hypothetical protein